MNQEVEKYYHPSILAEACSNYGIDPEQAQLIQGNANLIFDCGDQVLRLSHSCIRKAKDIASEMDWLLYLKERNLPVVGILRSNSGEQLLQIGEAENHFSCVCFEKIVGKKISNEGWNGAHFEKLGSLLGILHREGQQYQEKPEIPYQQWDEIVEFAAWKYLPTDERNLEALHQSLVEKFWTYPKTSSSYGLVHYDIHHGNYLLTGPEEKLMLFDFEMTCKSWYANDVAIAMHYAGHHPVSQQTEAFDSLFLEHFWRGYDKEYTLHQAERLHIPAFALYRELLVYGYLHKIYPTPEMRKPRQFLFDRLSFFIDKRRRELGR